MLSMKPDAIRKRTSREKNPQRTVIEIREQAWKRYGIDLTYQEYLVMLQAQNFQCALCHCEIDTSACVDHNHDTGKVRSLLCQPCNFLIGHCENSIMPLNELLKSVGAYLLTP